MDGFEASQLEDCDLNGYVSRPKFKHRPLSPWQQVRAAWLLPKKNLATFSPQLNLKANEEPDNQCVDDIDKKSTDQRYDDKCTVGGPVLFGDRRHIDDCGGC